MNERGVATRRKIQQWCFNDIMFPTDLVFKFVTRNYTHDVEIMRCGLAHNGTLFNRRQQFSAKDGTFKSSTFESYCNGKMTELHFRSSGYMHIDVDMDSYDTLEDRPSGGIRLRFCCSKKTCCHVCYKIFAHTAQVYLMKLLEKFIDLKDYIFVYSGSKGFHMHAMYEVGNKINAAAWKCIVRKFAPQPHDTFLDFLENNTPEDILNIYENIIVGANLLQMFCNMWVTMIKSDRSDSMMKILNAIPVEMVQSLSKSKYYVERLNWKRFSVLPGDKVQNYVAMYVRSIDRTFGHLYNIYKTKNSMGFMYILMRIFSPRMDMPVTVDDRHMIRIPLTPNNKTGNIAVVIPKRMLGEFHEYIKGNALPKMTDRGLTDEANILPKSKRYLQAVVNKMTEYQVGVIST